jgi:Family of unknown function (DUF6188)
VSPEYTPFALLSACHLTIARLSREMNMKLNEDKEGWLLGLEEGRLGYIHIDFRLGLDVTDKSGTASVIIETPCHLSSASGEMVLKPAETKSLAPVLELFNVAVEGISIRKAGHLRLVFGNGASITVEPDEMYEAWQIGCPSCGFLFVCCPGGEVSLFQHP